jgi:hypothetical protein
VGRFEVVAHRFRSRRLLASSGRFAARENGIDTAAVAGDVAGRDESTPAKCTLSQLIANDRNRCLTPENRMQQGPTTAFPFTL